MQIKIDKKTEDMGILCLIEYLRLNGIYVKRRMLYSTFCHVLLTIGLYQFFKQETINLSMM
jgi:hypothetical protein